MSNIAKGMSETNNILKEHGFPVAIATCLVIYLIWQTIASNALVREITESSAKAAEAQTVAARDHSDKLTNVIISDTKAKIEMTTAIKSLESASKEMGESLRSLEISFEKSRNSNQ